MEEKPEKRGETEKKKMKTDWNAYRACKLLGLVSQILKLFKFLELFDDFKIGILQIF